jgi:hypothetical protein
VLPFFTVVHYSSFGNIKETDIVGLHLFSQDATMRAITGETISTADDDAIHLSLVHCGLNKSRVKWEENKAGEKVHAQTSH